MVAAVRPVDANCGRPSVVGAEDVAGVQVEALDDVLAMVADVGHFGREVVADLALERDVPRVDLPFLQVRREVDVGGVAQARVRTDIDDAVARDVGHDRRREARRHAHAGRRDEGVGRVELRCSA